MTTYYVSIENWIHDVKFKHEGKEFDQIKIKSLNKQSFEVTACKNGLPYRTIKKRAKFENGNVSINFGKQVLNVGTYTVEALSV